MVNRLWSDEQPKQTGFYWCKDANGRGMVAQIQRGGVALFAGIVTPGPLKWCHTAIRFPSLYEANKVEKTLKELTVAIVDFLAALDAEMKQPSTAERGRKIALLSNRLSMANEAAQHFALDMSFDSMNALTKKRERLQRRNGQPNATASALSTNLE